VDNNDGEALRRTVYNPYNPQVPSILARFGFTNVVYFGTLFKEYEGTETVQREVAYLPAEFKLEKRFPSSDNFADAYVYGIKAPKATLVPIYQGDITVPHLDEGRITVRLMDRHGIISIENYAKKTLRARARIPLTNLQYPHDLVISQNGQTLLERQLRGNEAQWATVEFLVPPGGTRLRLEVQGKQWKLNPQERSVFGTQRATVRLGDLILESL
jgi:hypothetical protein